MKRIILVLLIISFFGNVWALEDLTPEGSKGSVNTALQTVCMDPQTQANISQLMSKAQALEDQLNALPDASDINVMKQEAFVEIETVALKFVSIFVVMLLVWQVFLFACLFYAKSKGWL